MAWELGYIVQGRRTLQNGGAQNTDLQYMDFTHMHYPWVLLQNASDPKMDHADEV